MLTLPPLYPITDASLDPRLSEQIRHLGEAGFPLVRFRGEPLSEEAQREELNLAQAASWENGGWPVICTQDPAEGMPQSILPGRSLEDAEGCFQAGAEALAMGRELIGSPQPSDLLWQAQCLRWRFRPPFRVGQGVALIGGSGCGKSTLARELGVRLRLSVKDLDESIVQRAGKSISRIFSEDGEPAFRGMETEVTCEAFQSPAVLALGGGAWESEAVRNAARASGFAVLWIAENPDRIWRRVAQDPGRPLAQERETFLDRWRTRMPRWMEAPMILPLGRTPDQLADALNESAGL